MGVVEPNDFIYSTEAVIVAFWMNGFQYPLQLFGMRSEIIIYDIMFFTGIQLFVAAMGFHCDVFLSGWLKCGAEFYLYYAEEL